MAGRERYEGYEAVLEHVAALWVAETGRGLTEERAVEGLGEEQRELGRAVFRGMQMMGCINTGPVDVDTSMYRTVQRKRVVVIGAGMAGIAAAHQLSKFGMQVRVLEASDRIGGRIYSIPSAQPDQAPRLDLGASIVTGQLHNPLQILLRQLKIPLVDINSKCPLFDTDGSLLDAAEDTAAEEAWTQILMGTDRLRETEPFQSLGTAISTLQQHLGSSARDDVLRWHHHNLEYGCAAPLTSVSLQHWDQDDPFEAEGAHQFLPFGFQSVLELLAADLDMELNKTVTAVHVDTNARTASVACSDGNTFECDHVMMTGSLGTLQKGHIDVTPPIPQHTLTAIQRLGFGSIGKLVLEFEDDFWSSKVQHAHMFGHVSTESNPFFLFWNLSAVVDSPVLVAIAGGSCAAAVEALDTDQCAALAMSLLRRTWPDAKDPIRATKTDWSAQSHIHGCYSYIAEGASGDDYETLTEPVHEILYFAGEGTCREFPATVTGAYVSGLRQSGKILARVLDQRVASAPSIESTSQHTLWTTPHSSLVLPEQDRGFDEYQRVKRDIGNRKRKDARKQFLQKVLPVVSPPVMEHKGNKEAVVEAVERHIKECIESQTTRLSSSVYKEILGKCVNKTLQLWKDKRRPPKEAFLTPKCKHRMTDLVQQYLRRHT